MAAEIFIEQLLGPLLPLRDFARELLGPDTVDSDHAIDLGHTPTAGPEAYAITLFKPLPEAQLASYQQIHGIAFPPAYHETLRHLNGFHAYKLSLFGLPASMTMNTPLLTRTSAQPFDLATANRNWRFEFSAPNSWLHIGGSPLSDRENLGHFQAPDLSIHAFRKGGEQWNSWPTLEHFLSEELTRCKAMYTAYVEEMADALSAKSAFLRRLWASARRHRN